MGDTLTPNPYEPGSDEDKAYRRSAVRAGAMIPSHLLSGFVGLGLQPGPEVKPGPVEQQLPGAVTQIPGMFLNMGDAVDKAVDWALGRKIQPTPDWLNRINELADSSSRRADVITHAIEPESPGEDVLANIGQAQGQMMLPIPGGAITRLPSVVQKVVSPVAHLVAPLSSASNLGKVLPLAAAGGLQVASAAANAADQPAAPPQPPQVQSVGDDTLPTPPIPPDVPPPPSKPAQWQVPNGLGLQAQPQLPDGASGLGLQPSETGTSGSQTTTPQTGESGLTYGQWLAAGLGLLGAAGGVRSGARGLSNLRENLGGERFVGPRDMSPGSTYADQKAAFDASRSTTNPTFTMGPQPQAPLSVNPFEERMLRAQAAAQDDTAVARAHMQYTDQNNQDIAHEFGNVRNPQAQNAAVRAFMETGKHDASGVQTQPMQDTLLRYGRLDEPTKNLVNNALWAGTEMDWRTAQQRQAIAQGQNPAGIRRYFGANDDASLNQMIADGLANPDAEAVIRGVWQAGRSNMDIARALGYPTADIQKVLASNPRYIPSVNPDGTITHVFGNRDVQPFSGPTAPPTPAIDAFMQHQDALLKQFATDRVNRMFVDSDQRAGQLNPNHANIFSKAVDAFGNRVSPTAEDSVTIPRQGGWETYRINNDEIKLAMKGSTPVKMGMAQASRNRYTRYTTGVMGTVAGRFFPAIHGWSRGPLLQMLNTPADMNASVANMLYRKMGGTNTGIGRVGNFLTRLSPDPYITAPLATADILANRAAHGVANMLLPGNKNIGNTLLRGQFGDAKIDALRNYLVNKYNNSGVARYLGLGAGDTGAYGSMLAPTYLRSEVVPGRNIHNPAAILAPRAVTATSPVGRRMPFTVNLNNLIHEVSAAFMEAPNYASYRLNEGLPGLSQARLVSETRGLLGDPGKTGRSSIAQGANRYLNYTNAATQDAARSIRARAEMPVMRPLTTSALMFSLAGASLYSAMHTPGGLSHLLNLLSTNQMTSPTFYNGKDTDATSTLSLPQTERFAYPTHLDILAHLLDAWDAHHDEGAFDRMYHSLSDLFSKHVWNNTVQATMHGASEVVNPYTNPPALLQTALGAIGFRPEMNADTMLDRAWRGRPFRFGVNTTQHNGPPGEMADDALIGDKLHSALAGMYGLGSDLVETINRGATAFKHDNAGTMHAMGSAFNAMLDNFSQHAKDQNPTFNNTLWNTDTRLSSNSPLAERVNKQMDALRDVQGTKSDIINQGFTRGKGVPLSGMADPKFSHDPVMVNMRLVANSALNQINTYLMPHVTDIRKQDKDMDHVTMPESQRREMHNQYMRQMNTAYIPVAKAIDTLNQNLSRIAGKPVDIGSGDIDWTKDHTQFAH